MKHAEEKRLYVVQREAEIHRASVPDDVALLIAATVLGNPTAAERLSQADTRLLRQAVAHVVTVSRRKGMAITADSVGAVLGR